MRRSSSTTSRWGASSGSAADTVVMTRIQASALAATAPRPVGSRDEPQHRVAVVGVDHGGEEAAGRLVAVRPDPGAQVRGAAGLPARELHGERLAFRRDVEQALAPVVRTLLLHHVALVDELLEHAAERLLGDLEDVEQLRNLHAGIAIDEMQHPVMGAPETEFRQHVVGIADEIPISEEQELDDVPDRLVPACPPVTGGK